MGRWKRRWLDERCNSEQALEVYTWILEQQNKRRCFLYIPKKIKRRHFKISSITSVRLNINRVFCV
jgi:hypothetical protein